jgi:putative transposase
MICTTNAIESLHMQLRKVLKTRGHFPSDEATTKLIYLVLRDITKKWTNPPITWKLEATQFAIRFGQRFFAVEILKTCSRSLPKPQRQPIGAGAE